MSSYSGADGRQWKYFMDEFSANNLVVSPDLPGHGKTLPLDYSEGNRPSLEVYSALVSEMIDRLGLQKPILVGCSIGANISLIEGTEHPQDIAAIVCVDGAAMTQTFTAETLLSQGQNVENTFQRCASNTMKSKILEVDWLRRSAPRQVYIADLFAWNSHNILDKINLIKAPVLLMRGKEDPAVSLKMLEETCRGIKDCRIVELDGCGHFPMVENPRLFNGAVKEFLAPLAKVPV